MIPDDTLLKATQAYNANVGFDHASPLALEAALEAVLPDVWDECAEMAAHHGAYDGGRAGWLADINPYRKEV